MKGENVYVTEIDSCAKAESHSHQTKSQNKESSVGWNPKIFV